MLFQTIDTYKNLHVSRLNSVFVMNTFRHISTRRVHLKLMTDNTERVYYSITILFQF